MKNLELNQMENLVAGDTCDTGSILGTMALSTFWGLVTGGPAGAVAGVLTGAGSAVISCVVTHYS
jgi:hypothetical protein